MSEVQIYLESLREAFSDSDGGEAKRIVSQIHSLFKADNLTQLEIDSGITTLLKSSNGKPSVLDLVWSNFMKSNFKEAVGNIFEFLSDLLNNYDKKLDIFVEDITGICLKVLRSSCHAEIKLKSHLPLSGIVCNTNWSQHIQLIADLTVDQIIFKKNTPNVLNKQLFLLGTLCEKHPEIMTQHSNRIGSSLMNLVCEDVSSAKIIFTAKEGMFAAVQGYMSMCDLDPAKVEKVYRCVKTFSDPRDSARKGFARGAVKLLSSKPGKVFSEHVCTDLIDWLQLLIRYVSSNNADDRFEGCFALSKVYEYIGDTLMTKGSCDYSIRRLQYLMRYFKEIISNPPDNKELEYKLALEGFAVITSKCRNLIGNEEFINVTEVLTQRAKLILRDEDMTADVENDGEGLAERMDKICMYINALAVLGSGAKDSLMDLIKVLISEYPECPVTKRNKVTFTVIRNIFLMDIQVLVPFIVKESCRHSISLSLQYTKQSKGNRDEHMWTYENFVDIWEALLTSYKGEDIFNLFIDHVLKIILQLDFSTKSSSNVIQTDVSSEFEEIEIPSHVPEYSFFVNLCDLTSTIIDLFGNEVFSPEWCRPWLNRIFAIVVEGLEKNPLATSLLKVAQSTLVVAKKLCIFDDENHKDTASEIMELFKILSINKSSGSHQLRSALFALQAPHQMLNEYILDIASDAFQVVLRNGKNNLDLISKVMDILDDWDSSIDRDSFRPLCVKLLPTLNDYLCSSGISDTKFLEGDRSTASRYEFATRRRRVLLTQGTSKQLEAVQQKIMRFLGKMDSDTLQCLLIRSEESDAINTEAEDMEDVELSYLSEKLKISIPCPEQKKIDVYLDSLVPRIKDLSLNSTNRDTRVTACQVLHSVILLLYGTHRTLAESDKKSLANTLYELTNVMLILAADTDTTIRDMFDPLLTESCHWFTSPNNAASVETEKFLLALMKGAYHPSDSLVREKACLALKEVVKWSVKQSSNSDLLGGPPGAAAILRSVCQGIVHPDAYRKRGAFLIFNTVASQVYQIESLIDKFLPEILYLTVSLLNTGHTTLDKHYVLYKMEAMKAVHVLLKCLQSKTILFKVPNPNRRTPIGFGKCLLKDIALWILQQSKNCNCRITAKRLFKTYTTISVQLDGSTQSNNLINIMVKSQGLLNVARRYLEPESVIDSSIFLTTPSTYLKSVGVLMNHISCLDCHILIHRHNIIDNNVTYTRENIESLKLFSSLKYLFSLDHTKIVTSLRRTELMRNQIEILENLLFQVYWKAYEMLIEIQKKSVAKVLDLYLDDMCTSVVFWLFDYDMWMILNRNVSSEDIFSIKQMISDMKGNLDGKKWDLFITRCETFKKTKLINIFENHNDVSMMSNSIWKYLDDLVDLFKIRNSKRLYSDLRHLDVSRLFDELFSSCNSPRNNEAEFRKHVINFLLNCDLLQLSDILNMLLNTSNDSTSVANFLKVYQDQLTTYFVNHYVDLLSRLADCHSYNMTIVSTMLRFVSEKKHKDDAFIGYLTNWIIQVWPKLTETNDFDSLLEYFTLLVIALPAQENLVSAHTMRHWLLQELKNSDRSIEKKTKLMYLLTAVCKPSDDTMIEEELSQALSSVTCHFPQRSDEFPVGSPEREKYLSTFRALLETMANSGNFAIFKAVVDTSCVDKEHICDKQIAHKIVSLMERLSPHQSFVMLDWVYAAFLSKSKDPSIKLNLLNRFLAPMLKAASVDALEMFYGEHILGVVGKLDKEVNTVICGEIPLKHLFVEWNSSFVLAEVMFSKIPDNILESPESKIGSHNKKWKSLFSQKCIKVRNVSVPSCDNQIQVMEYLRLTRCSAYKCLHCIVVTSSDERDGNKMIRKYELLLNNAKDTLLWEGMIDANKQYIFPLDQTCKLKHHTVRSKKSSNPESVTFLLNQSTLSQSFMGGVLQTDEEKRKMVFSQTLQDDILKYDFNMATTRDLTAVVIPNTQDQVILELEDTDLLNHEVLATVCHIMRDMDRITCPSMEEQHVAITPSWVQHLVAVLGDRRRPNNVKLFLSQVMVKLRENGTDVFKKYSRLCLRPLLSIIHDRCTTSTPGDNNLNFWDIGILLMLLSWRETAIPSTPEEMNSANFILEILIKQINPNTQTPELFKHSLDLLKDLLNIWGKFLKIPSNIVISKLQSEGDKLLTAGIQVTAVILACGCRPWDDDEQFEVLSKILIKLLNNSDSKIYKSSSEVIGLMLQLLYINNASNDTSDVDMESKDYSKYVALRDIARVRMKDFKSNKSKFIPCLYMMRKYHAEVCDESLVDFIVYLIPKLPVHTKTMCFKIFLSATDFMESSWLRQALINVDIKSYLKDKDLGVVCLHIVNKLMNKVELNVLLCYMEDICSLSNHKESEVREVAYEILMKAFSIISERNASSVHNLNNASVEDKTFLDFRMSSTSDSRKRPFESMRLDETTSSGNGTIDECAKYNYSSIKAALLLGMEDEEENLRKRLCYFWAEKLKNNLQERWLHTISELYVDKETTNQGCEMERAVRLVLEACKKAPDYETTKLFDNPLENCVFMDYSLDGKRPKQSSLLAPMFAETINSNCQLASLAQSLESGDTKKAELIASQIHSKLSSFNTTLLNQEQQFLRSTLDSVTSGFSLDSLGRSLPGGNTSRQSTANEGFSLRDESSLLFTMEPQLLHRRTYQPLPVKKQGDTKTETLLTSEEKLRRRLITNKNMQKTKFAAIAMEKNIRKEQKRLSEKPAPIFRSFRKGDYPDVQINLDNVVAPLLGLATRDPIFSKDLFIVVFKSLLHHCSEETMDSFKESTAQCVVSRLRTRSIPLTVEALMEVCRVCLKSGTEDINSLIRTVAKNNGVEWLGQLLLEELAMDGESKSSKRIKLEDGVETVVSLPPEMRSQIRSLKWSSQWDELQTLYQDATLNTNLGAVEKLHCTEEYFNCFARLSDWTGFMDGLKDHLTPDSMLEDDSCVDGVFDMNLLWSTKHRKDTYLHLVFMAHIHMRAAVDHVYNFKKANDKVKNRFKKELQSFTDDFNNWMREPDKNSVLEGRMIPYVSLWRAVNLDHSVEGCDGALKWLRQEWTRECSGATQSGLQSTLDIIQTISETRNYLDLMSKMSSSRTDAEVITLTLQNTQYSWQQCVPRPSNDTVAWDLRLACRSIYTCQLQNFIKSKYDALDEEEKLQYRVGFSKVQRHAELCLVKTALQQRNYHLAKKLVEKHIGYVNDVDEVLPWQLEEMRLEELAADRETNLQKKISSIFKSWNRGENVRKSLNSSVDVEYRVGLLGVSSNMADMLCSTLTKYPWEDCVPHLASHAEDLEALLPEGLTGLQKETILSDLINYSSSRLMECVNIVEQEGYESDKQSTTRLVIREIQERNVLKHKAETYMKMVRYARKAKQDYLNDVSSDGLLKLTISGILNGMRYGHMEARKLFPVLLLELEDLSEDHHLKKLFVDEISLVPCWMFISWAAQLLAYLPTQCPTLLPLLTRIAQQYPSALRHHYQLSKDMWGHLPHMKEAIERLDQLLFDVNTSTLVRAFGSLKCPWTSLKAYIERLCDENCDRCKVLDELREDMLCKDEGSTGMKLRGLVFGEIRHYVDKLEVIRTMEYGPEVLNVLREVLKACDEGQNKLPERNRLARFSPYLDSYRKNVSDEGVEVFGQYDGFQSNPPDPKNHVTIVKFHPEIFMFKGSIRRPIRMNLYGSNGRKYSFLVKCSEDLRQDNRIQQVLDLMNHPLNQISMHISTYKVFPLTQSLGVIEYVKGCATLSNIICYAGSNIKAMMTSVCRARMEYINQLEGSTITDRYGTLTAPENMPLNAAQFREKVKSIPGHFLRNSLQKVAGTSEMFVKMKTNFIRTLAPMNVAHWILGIGDRHLSNCMVSLNTGSVLGIDFGHAFGTATQQLHVPELMPFRLSPQIRGIIGNNDDLSELMWQSLSKLCEHRSLLLATMEVFVREPTLNWIKDDSQHQWQPRHKIDQCRRKLNGIDPITIVIEDLQNRTVGEKYTLNFCQIIRNVAREQKHLTVDQQVDRLIKLATDDGIMSVTFYGWNPYF